MDIRAYRERLQKLEQEEMLLNRPRTTRTAAQFTGRTPPISSGSGRGRGRSQTRAAETTSGCPRSLEAEVRRLNALFNEALQNASSIQPAAGVFTTSASTITNAAAGQRDAFSPVCENVRRVDALIAGKTVAGLTRDHKVGQVVRVNALPMFELVNDPSCLQCQTDVAMSAIKQSQATAVSVNEVIATPGPVRYGPQPSCEYTPTQPYARDPRVPFTPAVHAIGTSETPVSAVIESNTQVTTTASSSSSQGGFGGRAGMVNASGPVPQSQVHQQGVAYVHHQTASQISSAVGGAPPSQPPFAQPHLVTGSEAYYGAMSGVQGQATSMPPIPSGVAQSTHQQVTFATRVEHAETTLDSQHMGQQPLQQQLPPPHSQAYYGSSYYPQSSEAENQHLLQPGSCQIEGFGPTYDIRRPSVGGTLTTPGAAGSPRPSDKIGHSAIHSLSGTIMSPAALTYNMPSPREIAQQQQSNRPGPQSQRPATTSPTGRAPALSGDSTRGSNAGPRRPSPTSAGARHPSPTSVSGVSASASGARVIGGGGAASRPAKPGAATRPSRTDPQAQRPPVDASGRVRPSTKPSPTSATGPRPPAAVTTIISSSPHESTPGPASGGEDTRAPVPTTASAEGAASASGARASAANRRSISARTQRPNQTASRYATHGYSAATTTTTTARRSHTPEPMSSARTYDDEQPVEPQGNAATTTTSEATQGQQLDVSTASGARPPHPEGSDFPEWVPYLQSSVLYHKDIGRNLYEVEKMVHSAEDAYLRSHRYFTGCAPQPWNRYIKTAWYNHSPLVPRIVAEMRALGTSLRRERAQFATSFGRTMSRHNSPLRGTVATPAIDPKRQELPAEAQVADTQPSPTYVGPRPGSKRAHSTPTGPSVRSPTKAVDVSCGSISSPYRDSLTQTHRHIVPCHELADAPFQPNLTLPRRARSRRRPGHPEDGVLTQTYRHQTPCSEPPNPSFEPRVNLRRKRSPAVEETIAVEDGTVVRRSAPTQTYRHHHARCSSPPQPSFAPIINKLPRRYRSPMPGTMAAQLNHMRAQREAILMGAMPNPAQNGVTATAAALQTTPQIVNGSSAPKPQPRRHPSPRIVRSSHAPTQSGSGHAPLMPQPPVTVYVSTVSPTSSTLAADTPITQPLQQAPSAIGPQAASSPSHPAAHPVQQQPPHFWYDAMKTLAYEFLAQHAAMLQPTSSSPIPPPVQPQPQPQPPPPSTSAQSANDDSTLAIAPDSSGTFGFHTPAPIPMMTGGGVHQESNLLMRTESGSVSSPSVQQYGFGVGGYETQTTAATMATTTTAGGPSPLSDYDSVPYTPTPAQDEVTPSPQPAHPPHYFAGISQTEEIRDGYQQLVLGAMRGNQLQIVQRVGQLPMAAAAAAAATGHTGAPQPQPEMVAAQSPATQQPLEPTTLTTPPAIALVPSPAAQAVTPVVGMVNTGAVPSATP